jgi:hypothetical protein
MLFSLLPLDGPLYHYMLTAVSRLGLNVHGVRSSMLFIPRHQPHRDLYRMSLLVAGAFSLRSYAACCFYPA